MCSVVVVLPASMWAMIPILRILLRLGSLSAMAASPASHEIRNPKLEIRSRTVGFVFGFRISDFGFQSGHHAKWAKALFDSAILMVFSRLVIASPSRR